MSFYSKIIKSKNKEDESFCCQLKKLLRFKPIELSHYKKAFIHRSSRLFDQDGIPINYERLEFLGDAILSSIIASYLYKKVPKADEGYLTQMRAKVVSREHLNALGKKLELLKFVKIGETNNKISEDIYGNIFESLIGAIYLDRGYNYCHQFVYNQVILPYISIESLEEKISSYKGFIIEWCQKNKKKYQFDFCEDDENKDKKYFSVRLYIDNSMVAKGRAASKKKAEEIAAKQMYYAMQDKMS
ncbi:MAG: ribonuclease III [Tenacibaculum sp.]